MAANNTFTTEQRKQAAARVRLSRAGKSDETLADIARDLGTTYNSLSAWAKLYPLARLAKKRGRK